MVLFIAIMIMAVLYYKVYTDPLYAHSKVWANISLVSAGILGLMLAVN